MVLPSKYTTLSEIELANRIEPGIRFNDNRSQPLMIIKRSKMNREFVLPTLRRMYRFDVELACVQVFNWNENITTVLQTDGQMNQSIKRVSVPYERFFKCPSSYRAKSNFQY